MEATDPWKDKYGYDIPRCHHINQTGARCNAAPITGDHFCPCHHPDYQPEPEAQHTGGPNHRGPKPAPLIPPNLPRISLEKPEDAGALFEETINFVRTGEMDLRVASTLGYLTMGWMQSFQLRYRVAREAVQDHDKAADRVEKAAEKAAKKSAEEAAKAAEESTDPSTRGFLTHDKYGRKHRFTPELVFTTYGPDGGTEVYRGTRDGLEFVSSTAKHPPILRTKNGPPPRCDQPGEAKTQNGDVQAHNFKHATAPPSSEPPAKALYQGTASSGCEKRSLGVKTCQGTVSTVP
jgi:hypothetical protein